MPQNRGIVKNVRILRIGVDGRGRKMTTDIIVIMKKQMRDMNAGLRGS